MVALCDIDPFGQHGVTAIREQFPNARFYTDFRTLLEEEKDLDAVTISTPDHTHANISMAAMDRGVHVYVQKPLTHNIKEARLLTETARVKKIVTQMGNQGGIEPRTTASKTWIDSGQIGAVHTVKVWTNRPVWPQGPCPNQIPKIYPKAWLGTHG